MFSDREAATDVFQQTAAHFFRREATSRICARSGAVLCDFCLAPGVEVGATAALGPRDGAIDLAESSDAGLVIALGRALEPQVDGERAVQLCLLRDAPKPGTVALAGMELAFRLKLPIVFVRLCAESASAPWGIPRQELSAEESLDVLAVRARIGAAVERARAGEGPSFFEALADPARDRCRSEACEGHPGRCRDHASVAKARERLLARGVPRSDLEGIEIGAERSVNEEANGDEPHEPPPRWYWW